MNKRIEELSLQCIRYKLIAEGARSDFDYKKFAELMLADVLNIVGNGGEFCSRPKLVEQIQTHFGVEE